MTRADMYKGRFKLRNSPYPTLQVCDYPDNQRTLNFLEDRIGYLFSIDSAMPVEMLTGLCGKMERTQEALKEKKEDPFFISS